MAIRPARKAALVAACPDVELGDELGAGGNARVYEGTSAAHGPVAVKFMLNDDTTRYGRFRDEVLVVTTTLAGSKHVVPILEHHVPPDPPPEGQYAWYVMPKCRRLTDCVRGKSWSEKLEVLAQLAEGLAEIHALEVAHRDIKPDNLLQLGGTYRFADFGIASFPDKSGLTKLNQPMGPWAFMAPEMLSDATTANPFKADVYSFAKTIWCVLTDKKVPFIGPYGADTLDGLVQHRDSSRFVVEPLDALLTACTAVNPLERPSTVQLASALRQAIAVQSDYKAANKLQWEAAEAAALRAPGLVRTVWEGPTGIAEVLTLLGRRHGMNHCFMPDGGGHTLSGAFPCEGGEMLALRYEDLGLSVVKPVRLTLERFPGHPELSYVVLETADSARLGDGKNVRASETEEYLLQLNDSDYAADDSDRDEPRNAGKGEYCQRRFKRGTFIIAPTTGAFNGIDDYMGTEGKTEGLRSSFDAYVKTLATRQTAAAVVKRSVRLLEDATVAQHQLELQYIDDSLLIRLIQADDALSRNSDPTTPGRILSIDDLMSAKRQMQSEPSPEEAIASEILAGMSNSQRAELMTLVEIGRNRLRLGNVKARLEEHLESDWSNEEDYLLEKLGSSYLRKALSRYGLTSAEPTPADNQSPG